MPWVLKGIVFCGVSAVIAGCLGFHDRPKNGMHDCRLKDYSCGFLTDSSLSFSPDGDLFLTAGGWIWRMDTNGVIHNLHPLITVGDQLSISAMDGLFSATAVTAGRHGVVYVADATHNTILEVETSGAVRRLAGQHGMAGFRDGWIHQSMLSHPTSLALDNDQNLIIADRDNNAIRRVSLKDDARLQTIVGHISTSYDAAFVPGVRKHAGNLRSRDGPATTARFRLPLWVAVDICGRIVVVSGYEGDYEKSVRVIDPNGMVRTLAGGESLSIFDSVDGVGTNAVFCSPVGIAVDAANNIYIPDRLAIRKVTPDGVVTTFAGSNTAGGGGGSIDGMGAMARFKHPSGLAFSPGGELYVMDGDRLRKISPDGMVSTVRVRIREDELIRYNKLIAEMMRMLRRPYGW